MLKTPTKMVKNFNYRFFSQLFKWYIDYEKTKEKDDENEDNLEFLPRIRNWSKTMKQASDVILSNALDASNSLKYDFGLFLGAEFRKKMDTLIHRKTGVFNCKNGCFATYENKKTT